MNKPPMVNGIWDCTFIKFDAVLEKKSIIFALNFKELKSYLDLFMNWWKFV